jgi:hypothetical protein
MHSMGDELEELRTRKRKTFKDKNTQKPNKTTKTKTTKTNHIPTQEDELENKKTIKFTKEDAAKDRKLTQSLFSELKENRDTPNYIHKQKIAAFTAEEEDVGNDSEEEEKRLYPKSPS